MKEQPHQDRRSFLKAMGSTTAVLAAVPAVLKPSPAEAQDNVDAAALAGSGRSYTSGHFAIEIDGAHAGWLRSAEGGHAVADVVEQKVEGSLFAKKHIANVKYEDISITFGLEAGSELLDWVSSTLSGKVTRKNGAIIAADFNYKERARREFVNALITEVGFPALDAASKEPAYMTIKLAPEYTQPAPPSLTALPKPDNRQKKWLSSNFKLEIAGLDCSRVNKIEALTLKQKVSESSVGGEREFELEPTSIEIPNLVITTPETHSADFYKWHEDFVINGNNSDEEEKGGTLHWLDPQLKSLGALNFLHLGIFKAAPEKPEAGGENIRRVKAEMYCEKIEFKYSGAPVG